MTGEHRSGSTAEPPPRRAETLFNWLAWGAVTAALLFVPLLLGGRHAAGEMVLAACAALALTAVLARQAVARHPHWTPIPFAWLLVAGHRARCTAIDPASRAFAGGVVAPSG